MKDFWVKLHARDVLVSLSLILCSLLIATVIAEFTVRALFPERVPVGPRTVEDLPHDEALGFSYTPGTQVMGGEMGEVFDALGYRNATVTPPYDIVALGDSHTAGSFNQWTRALASSSGLSVYNMGVHGYGVAQYRYLMTKAIDLHPKIIIVGLYIGNDIFDTYDTVYHLPYWETYRSKDFVDDAPMVGAGMDKITVNFRGIRDWLHKHVVLYSLVSESTRKIREILGLATPRYTGTTDWTNPIHEAGLRYDEVPEQKTIFWAGFRRSGIDMNDKNVNEGMRLTSVLLSEMAEQAKASGSTLFVAILPTKDRVYYHRVKHKADTNTLYPGNVAFEDELRSKVLALCKTSSISCVDVLPVMEAALDRGEVIYPNTWDDHPNSHGYTVYADGIYEGLKRAYIAE